ncbi:glycoside hydrolase family 88/105 protein [Metabacillus bambusae]|uniref:Glycoside hydrolase family 88 protein n=1 Tax=Metabacillus bambusae TaxID=2795218 RepID=A0ABS3N9R9_9BACI|nr:glycoside hydrolase family 88 protein [Metabacillus bambusae]MBO1514992.1 glycoside hydrolase family 88 protein [Metabacillus bambusae]
MDYELVGKLKTQYMNGCGKWYSSRWHYIEGCILKSYLDSYQYTGNEDDYLFVKNFVDNLFNEYGDIDAIKIQYYNIDQIRMTSILFTLFKKEGDLKYKRILDLIYNQLESYPRTDSGSFWHKTNYENQVWLDGLYMGQPFYVQYIKEFKEKKDYSDILQQFRNVRKFLFDEKTQLYAHAYDESREMFWCDKKTGRSPHVWGRAVGWYVMALVDILEILEGEEGISEELKSLLEETVDGMLKYQHDNGMWYQVVDHIGEEGNYLETSGTSMLSYAILKGVRLGYLPKKYKDKGVAAFEGTVKRYIREENGEVLLGGICRSAGLGTNPDTGIVRDGSYEYYVYREKVVENNGHGVAPLLMAYNEMLMLK